MKKYTLMKRDITTKKEKVVQTHLLQEIAKMKVRQANDAQNLMAGKYIYYLIEEK